MTRRTRPKITLETLQLFNAAASTDFVYQVDGEVLEDVDGSPIAVAPPTLRRVVCAPLTVTLTRAEAAELNIDPADYPHLTILEETS